MNPYESLPSRAFWRQAIAERSAFDIGELWQPKFHILPQNPVATFGSCFAQHIGRALRSRRYRFLITEAAPNGLAEDSRRSFNYDVFTCRTGNIYTTSLLRQWVSWAVDDAPRPAEIWVSNERYLDPFRPRIEPDGFESEEELVRSREVAIAAFRESIVRARYLVFTLGLTESWTHAVQGYEYPMCPGTAGGVFDGSVHRFVNQDYATVQNNLEACLASLRGLNRRLQILLTVSPVSLTATNGGDHILVANTYSKSVLRAVAGRLAEVHPYVDYFPAYEIVTSAPFRGMFFVPNQRTVSSYGVDYVMNAFFADLYRVHGAPEGTPAPASGKAGDDVCEEQLLAAFGGRR